MNKCDFLKKLACLSLTISMLLSMAVPAMAEENGSVRFEQVENDRVSASLLPELAEELRDETPEYAADEQVRVSIVLEGESTIGMGYETRGIADNASAMRYRERIAQTQTAMTRSIEREIGEALDVQWNLTLAANIISANVEYGQIETITQMDGVQEVVIEQQYLPLKTERGTADPQMIISTGMTGMIESWNKGYTGAGRRIAIIDTGIDVDHQSFSGAALEYALKQNAEDANMDTKTYLAGLDLLDGEEIQERLWQLNVVGKDSSATGENLYRSSKIPFAFNYVDQTYEYVDHNQDSQSDHGSHVAGIAAANRYIAQDGELLDALETVSVAGAAPDAQLLVMKVFGMSGGAYDSDYMAAIEDAVMLGADSVNLSLGTAANGYSMAGVYQYAMDNLEKAGTVVCMAAGNEGYYARQARTKEMTGGSGLLYTDDVMYDRMGSPASYTNAMAVASVENQGMVSNAYLSFGSGEEAFTVGYSETLYGSMKEFTSLDTEKEGGTEYPFVLIDGLGKIGDLDFIDVKNKIVFISRGGGIAFYEKAKYAVDQGAIATVIYNNVDGSIGMDLTDYPYEQPAVAITKSDAEKIRSVAEQAKDPVDGKVYYTGTLRVHGTATIISGDANSYTMSDFSSWGTTGDLALKPEISAPGGNIYSVKGDVAATDRYKINSGTSMAAPQVSGISAVIQQYVEENHLTDLFGHSSRQISQSLLMASAIPMKDADGNYYPVIQQGAGLANGSGAIDAGAYILMGEDATPSYADGKVKAELGDDPHREGIYTFTFTLYNTEREEKVYALSADLFTQGVKKYASAPGSKIKTEYALTSTRALDSYALFLDADGIRLTGNTVTVPGEQSVEIQARLVITDDGKDWLETNYDKGTYIQAYVFAKPKSTEEGLQTGSKLSIPVLAFYGSWTDPSMYDAVSSKDGEMTSTYSTPDTTDESRVSYAEAYSLPGQPFKDSNGDGYGEGTYVGTNHLIVCNAGKSGVGSIDYGKADYVYGGNPLIPDEEYMPERNALSGSVDVQCWRYLPGRDADSAYTIIRNADTGEVYYQNLQERTGRRACFYAKSAGMWQGGQSELLVHYTLPQVAEGQTVEMMMMVLPEYYNEGKMGYLGNDAKILFDSDKIGEGAKLVVRAVVDSTSPKVESIVQDTAANTLSVTATDENYIAGLALFSDDGTQILSYTGSDLSLDQGETGKYVLDVSNLANGHYLLQVYDYAMNTATYYMELEESTIIYSGAMLAFNLEDNQWVQVDKRSSQIPAVTEETRIYTAAVAVEEKIYAIAYGTELWCLNVANPEQSAFVGDTNYTIVDLCYNAADGCLYGVSDTNKLVRIHMETGKGLLVGTMPLETNTIACDANGVFFSNLYGSGKIYSYTIDSLGQGEEAYDFDGSGVVDLADAQALLDSLTGKGGAVQYPENSDLDGDGDTDTYDVSLLLDKLPDQITLVADTGIVSHYLQAMEFDPNDGTLYWTSYSSEQIGSQEVGFSFLYEIDTENGTYRRYADLWDQLSSLVVLDKDAGSQYGPVDGVVGLAEAVKATSAQSEVQSIASDAETAGIAADFGVISSENVTDKPETQTICIEITADMAATNGLYTVTYDGEQAKLLSAESDARLVSIAKNEGCVRFAFVEKPAVEANAVLATLTFETDSCAADVTILCEQLGAEHPATEKVVSAGAHAWSDWEETAASCVKDGFRTRSCDCGETETQVIPADKTLHNWSEWKETKAVSANTPGMEERTCGSCGIMQKRWITVGITTTDQNCSFGQVKNNNEALLAFARVTGAGLERVSKLTTKDGSLRYVATLSAVTDWNGTFDVYLQPVAVVGSGFGSAIKREPTGGVGWDEDETDYTVTLSDGTGKLTAYCYIASDEYVLFEIYFMVGETGDSYGRRDLLKLPDLSESGSLRELAVWESAGIAKTHYEVDEQETNIYYTVWLDGDTPDDGRLLLEPCTVSDALLLTEADSSADVRENGVEVQLENGKGSAALELTTKSGVVRTYHIDLRNHTNRAPVLTGNAVGRGRIQVNTAFTLDLNAIFTDPDGDAMTFQYSVDGGEIEQSGSTFCITPNEVGVMTVTFTASDATMTSEETYTLTLEVTETAFTAGDVNDDGAVNSKDVTVLKRYIAKWPGVTVNTAAADVNNDGAVNSKDVTVLKRYIAKWPGISIG